MPRNEYTSPGSYFWVAPFATRNVTATAIGGGGSGFKDTTDNKQGGGGGGGGFARSTRSVAGGTGVSIIVGAGGASPGNQSGNNGGNSGVYGGALNVTGFGGQRGRDGVGGGGGGASGDVTGNGENGQEDANDVNAPEGGGRGGGAGKPGGNAGGCGGRGLGGQGVTLDGTNGGCTGGRRGGRNGGGGAGNDNGGNAGAGGHGAVRIDWDYHPPSISSFSGTDQNSLNGTPQNTVFLSWSTQYADNISISGIGGVPSSFNSYQVNTGLQSSAPGSSPAQRSYTLTASGPGGSTSRTITVSVRNDNSPSFLSNDSTGIPGGVSISSLEPGTRYYTRVNFGGVDMPTFASAGAGTRVSNNGSSWSSNTLISTNQSFFFVEYTSPPFNTSTTPGGTNSSGEIIGQTSSQTVSYSFGTSSGSFTVTTRAPVIQETFNLEGSQIAYPNPDIDTLSPDVHSPYIISGIETMNDIEIPVEIKSSDSNSQVSINRRPYQDLRST